MIDQLKKNMTKKNVLAWLVFGAIILVFVFFGFTTTQQTMGYAARVNSELISIRDFQAAVDNLSQYKALFGRDEEQAMKGMRNNAINQLIDFELVTQNAAKVGFQVTNDELIDDITSESIFMENGKFSRSRYDSLLAANNLTPASHEGKIKKQKVFQKFYRTFLTSFVPQDFEIKKMAQLKEKQVNLEFLKIDYEDVDKTKITKEEFTKTLDEAKSLYSKNKSDAIKKLESMGLKWKETGLFGLDADTIPSIGSNEKAFEMAFSLKNKNDLADTILDSYGASFVLKLKEAKNISDKEKEELQANNKSVVSPRASGIYSKWLMELKKTNNIQINPSVTRLLD